MPRKSTRSAVHQTGELDGRSVMRAWENYHLGNLAEDDPDLGVRSAIHQSWVRSNAAGIDTDRGEAPSAEAARDIDRLKHANRKLCKAARNSLDKIGRMLHGTEAMLILTDERGLVIEAIGDPKTISAGRDINLYVGGLWNEQAVGTNGIGTTLWAGEPMFVHGAEHYVETLKEWSCAAAPIRDPVDQSVIGAVDLSGMTKIFRHHNAAFAAAAAGEIQGALAQKLNQECIQLLDALIEQVPSAGRDDGVLILDPKGRVLHRRGFERLILADGTELDTRMGRRLFEIEGEASPEAIAAKLPPTLGCRDISSLRIDGEVRGLALMLDRGKSRSSGHGTPAIDRSSPPRIANDTGFVAQCPAMLDAIDMARRVARVNAPVLVQGDTGTGKELFARLIHAEFSGDKATPFVAVNCGAISRELFGGELFGHVSGAFTGAVKEGRVGKLEQAGGGVFCLDEIGEMPIEIQPYLLRVLEERVIYRLGDNKARPFDARLIALTNRDLRAEVDAGRFRSDLYYRINAVTVQVPLLKDRGEDILLLMDHFNDRIAEEFGIESMRFSPEVQDIFLRYRWPGNVRELRNLIQRLHSTVPHRDITISDIPPEIEADGGEADAAGAGKGSLKAAEKTLILEAIRKHDCNLSRVAAELGITRPTLYRKLKLYQIERVFR